MASRIVAASSCTCSITSLSTMTSNAPSRNGSVLAADSISPGVVLAPSRRRLGSMSIPDDVVAELAELRT